MNKTRISLGPTVAQQNKAMARLLLEQNDRLTRMHIEDVELIARLLEVLEEVDAALTWARHFVAGQIAGFGCDRPWSSAEDLKDCLDAALRRIKSTAPSQETKG